MATNYYDDDEDNDTTTDVVSQLRKVNRTLEKRAKELEQELAGLKTQTRQRTVKDVLQAKGLNPKIAAFIPQDIDSSEEAITTWVNEYGDVFGIQTQSEEKPVQKNFDAEHPLARDSKGRSLALVLYLIQFVWCPPSHYVSRTHCQFPAVPRARMLS